MILETPVFDQDSALKAAKYGVDRIELCSSYSEGGLTPGAGLLSYLKTKINIPIFVMIRPRGGHFVSSEDEIEAMKKEIDILSSQGADGFVFGVLKKDGSVHKKACDLLIDHAQGKPCTFHRAIDVSLNISRALEDIIECGFNRVLTSGGKKDVDTGLLNIKKLLKQAGDRIIIMPGGGLKPVHLPVLKKTGLIHDVHASCIKIERLPDLFVNKELDFKIAGLDSDEILSIDEQKIRDFKRVFLE